MLQFPEYYEAYVATLASDPDALLLITVFRGDHLIALFPLQKTVKRIGLLKIHILEFLETPCIRRDAIIDPDEELSEVIGFLQKHLQANTGVRWDLMRLKGVPGKSALITDGNLSRGMLSLRRLAGNNNYQDLRQSDSLKDQLPSLLLKNLRKRRKKLDKLGTCEFITVDSYAEQQDSFKEFLDVEASGWKSQKGGKRAIKLHDDQVAFYGELMKRYADRRGCQIHLLKLNNQTIAANFCICVNDTCYILKSGYDETYSKVSPGQLLREYVLNYYISDSNICYVDLIAAYEWQKHWHPCQRRVIDVYFFSRTIIGLMLYGLMGVRMRFRLSH